MHESEKWKWSLSVVSDSSWPHGLQPTRLLYPWDFPGKSIGVGCLCLLWYCKLGNINHLVLLEHGIQDRECQELRLECQSQVRSCKICKIQAENLAAFLSWVPPQQFSLITLYFLLWVKNLFVLVSFPQIHKAGADSYWLEFFRNFAGWLLNIANIKNYMQLLGWPKS